MPLFKAQMTWSQFKRGEIVEILDEDLPKFARAITPRSEGGLGRLKPYTEDDVIPPLYEPRGPLTEAQVAMVGEMADELEQQTVEPPDPGPQE